MSKVRMKSKVRLRGIVRVTVNLKGLLRAVRTLRGGQYTHS